VCCSAQRRGPGDILATPAGSLNQLPAGRTGYGQLSDSAVVACGITADLILYQRSASSPTTAPAAAGPQALAYLAEVRFKVDHQHAPGFNADLPSLGPGLQVFEEFVASVAFDAPQCLGG
jgi:hypothetical protein